MSRRRRPASTPLRAPRTRPTRRRLPVRVRTIEERGLALVRELHRIARGADAPSVKLEGALEILFGAFSGGDEPFRLLLLDGWLRAREQKPYRLAMAWLREQMRLCIEEILTEGITAGSFREDADPGALAAVCLGTAEGCLLQPDAHAGTVAPDQLVKILLGLAARPPKRPD